MVNMQKYQHVIIVNMQNIVTCKINNMHVASYNMHGILPAVLARVLGQKYMLTCQTEWKNACQHGAPFS